MASKCWHGKAPLSEDCQDCSLDKMANQYEKEKQELREKLSASQKRVEELERECCDCEYHLTKKANEKIATLEASLSSFRMALEDCISGYKYLKNSPYCNPEHLQGLGIDRCLLYEVLLSSTPPRSCEEEIPGHLKIHVDEWLTANKKKSGEVRWGSFPLGMVQRWIERAKKAENE